MAPNATPGAWMATDTTASGQNVLDEIQNTRWADATAPPGLWTPGQTAATGSSSGAYYSQISHTTTPATYTQASNITITPTTGEN